MTLTIRRLDLRELEVPLQWAAEEGWNPGLADAEPFHSADPNGFFAGFLDGSPIASISVVRYPDNFGFLGLYIVKPEHRGNGYGIAVWQAGLRHLDGCVVGLDGVVAQQPNYAKAGFVFAHRNVRYSVAIPAAPALPGPQVEVVGPHLIDAVVAYDRQYFPSERRAFLQPWLRPDRRKAFAFLGKGEVQGYCAIRECQTGFKIGPLFAEASEIAVELFKAAARHAAGSPIYVDIPEPNNRAEALISGFGLRPVFETARMYKGPAPTLPLEKVYGITTLELG